MAITRLNIDEFLKQSAEYPVLDVRSPGEYAHAHIPGAISFPLFSDEERKMVGTTYKQQSREDAIKIGLDYFGPKMRTMVEEAEHIAAKAKTKTLLVHCWRGGMRSAAIAWLLDLYGFKVHTLAGGYKSFRHWAIKQMAQPYPFKVLGGYTGSGKTEVLHQLKKQGQAIIDLEGIASHKGSAFGSLDRIPQPSQEMFENLLAMELDKLKEAEEIWIEDESQRIGLINLPNDFWKAIRQSQVYFIDIPFEERLNYIVRDYGSFDKEKLVNAIIRIRKRLGGLDVKNAVNYILEDNIKECFRILLRYYDKHYLKALNSRDNIDILLHNIPVASIDINTISKKLTDKIQTN